MSNTVCEDTVDFEIDLSAPGNLKNPYRTYQYLRDHDPVCRVGPWGFWAISRYDDVQFAFRHPEFFSSSGFKTIHQVDWLDKSCWIDFFILTQDPPVHTTHRAIVNKAFVKRVIDALIPFMREKIRSLLKNIPRHTDIAFMKEIAYPYAGAISLKITGTEGSRSADDLHQWVKCLESLGPIRPDDATVKKMESIITQQHNYFDEVIADRRRRPRQDLVSEIVNAITAEGKPLTDSQMRNALNLFVAASFHSSMYMLGKSVLYLSQHPDLHKQLAESPLLIPAFIEEMLRYNSSVHGLMRRTSRAVTLSGVEIPEGEPVLLLPASANRDPRKFTSPDTFDMSRSNTREHIAFGHGPHTCIGSALARLELKIALEEIITTFPRITCPPEDQLNWVSSITINSFDELPTQFG